MRFLFLILPLLLPEICCAQQALTNNSLKNFVIAIDVGHTPSNYGATSARGRKEYEFNRIVSEELLQKIHAAGFVKSFIVPAPEPKLQKIQSLMNRTQYAKQKNTDLFISIHHDAVQNFYLQKWMVDSRANYYCDRFSGHSLLVSTKNIRKDSSIVLARCIGDKMGQAGFHFTRHHAEKIKGESREWIDSTRGIYKYDDLIVLKTAAMPAVLIECGIIVNRKDELTLSDPKNISKMAGAIAEGVRTYFVSVGKLAEEASIKAEKTKKGLKQKASKAGKK